MPPSQTTPPVGRGHPSPHNLAPVDLRTYGAQPRHLPPMFVNPGSATGNMVTCNKSCQCTLLPLKTSFFSSASAFLGLPEKRVHRCMTRTKFWKVDKLFINHSETQNRICSIILVISDIKLSWLMLIRALTTVTLTENCPTKFRTAGIASFNRRVYFCNHPESHSLKKFALHDTDPIILIQYKS